MAPRVGLEPTTTRLTAECSTIELSRSEMGYLIDVLYNNTNELRKSTGFREIFFVKISHGLFKPQFGEFVF